MVETSRAYETLNEGSVAGHCPETASILERTGVGAALPIPRRSLLAGSSAAFIATFSGLRATGPRILELPGVSGECFRVEIAPLHIGIQAAHAQGYYNATTPQGGYYAYYAAMARMQQLQWVQYQQALAAYQQSLMQLQNQYTWLGQPQQTAFQAASSQFSKGGFQLSGTPYVMEAARSVYGFARDSGLGNVIMYGASKLNLPTWIKSALPAAGALWSALGAFLGWDEPRKEKAIAPQNKEAPVKVSLPDGSLLDGQGYITLDGGVAVTGQNVMDYNTGKTGPLAKVAVNGDAKYLII